MGKDAKPAKGNVNRRDFLRTAGALDARCCSIVISTLRLKKVGIKSGGIK